MRDRFLSHLLAGSGLAPLSIPGAPYTFFPSRPFIKKMSLRKCTCALRTTRMSACTIKVLHSYMHTMNGPNPFPFFYPKRTMPQNFHPFSPCTPSYVQNVKSTSRRTKVG